MAPEGFRFLRAAALGTWGSSPSATVLRRDLPVTTAGGFPLSTPRRSTACLDFWTVARLPRICAWVTVRAVREIIRHGNWVPANSGSPPGTRERRYRRDNPKTPHGPAKRRFVPVLRSLCPFPCQGSGTMRPARAGSGCRMLSPWLPLRQAPPPAGMRFSPAGPRRHRSRIARTVTPQVCRRTQGGRREVESREHDPEGPRTGSPAHGQMLCSVQASGSPRLGSGQVPGGARGSKRRRARSGESSRNLVPLASEPSAPAYHGPLQDPRQGPQLFEHLIRCLLARLAHRRHSHRSAAPEQHSW